MKLQSEYYHPPGREFSPASELQEMAGASTGSAVGFTSQITAAFRAVELQHSTAPIICDRLAPHLGRAAWETAYQDW